MLDRWGNYKIGLKAGIPIAISYFAVSFSFGILAVKGGLSVWESVCISLTNLTSAGQFAGLDIIVAGGTLGEMALTQLIINMRYCLMSLSISQKLDKRFAFFHRFIIAFGMTDEIFAVSASMRGKASPYFHYGAMSLAIPGWTLGTFLGAVGGMLLPGIVISALSVSIYGMFIAIILPPAKKNKAILMVIICAMALSSVFYYVPILKNISSGFVIIIVTVLVSLAAALIKPVKEEESNT